MSAPDFRFDYKNNPPSLDEISRAFKTNGVAVLDGFLTDQQCDNLRDHMDKLVRVFTLDQAPSVFSTSDRVHDQDEYFLSSGDKIHYFFEEHAFDQDGKLQQDLDLSINKVGHALHDLDPVFQAFSHNEKLDDLAKAIGLNRPKLVQSMYIFKQPRIGGEVNCHQDETFLRTDPSSVTGFWFALEDATINNGCLYALPGMHHEPIRQCYCRNDKGVMVMDDQDDKPWPIDQGIAVEVPKGGLVLLHGQLPHWSASNRSEKSRQAYVIHAIDGASDYLKDNWLQRGDDMPLVGFNEV
jgi:phytanoyl-CoA hydroxylase